VSLHVWSSARFGFPLPLGHRFPLSRIALLHECVERDGIVEKGHLHEPDPISWDALVRVHHPAYLTRFAAGSLADHEQRRLGLPWSAGLVERTFRTMGGTLAAAAHALEHGVAMNLGGGTHHAFADHGEGFCALNDVAVAIRALQTGKRIRRAVVIDLDVHQGNGTHAIFAGDPTVTTLSVHGRNNYPFRRVAGSLDIDLEDRTGDDEYIERLTPALSRILRSRSADLAFFIAGADPHEGDQLGRLALTFDGLAQRDALVLAACVAAGVPVCVVTGGGYGRRLEDSVTVHVNTVRTLQHLAAPRPDRA
jgi:acetoin utilization deacetylase AcuC-like enzyme